MPRVIEAYLQVSFNRAFHQKKSEFLGRSVLFTSYFRRLIFPNPFSRPGSCFCTKTLRYLPVCYMYLYSSRPHLSKLSEPRSCVLFLKINSR